MENNIPRNLVIDQREKGWFLIPNDFLNGYAKNVGWQGQLVYMALSRHADKKGMSFPSIKHLAKELGVSEWSIEKGITSLKEFNIIKVEMRTKTSKGRGSNLYYLIDKKDWKKTLDWSNRKRG